MGGRVLKMPGDIQISATLIRTDGPADQAVIRRDVMVPREAVSVAENVIMGLLMAWG